MKSRNIVLRIALLLMIALSVVLSWLIWTNNARFQRDTTDLTAKQTDTTTVQKLSEVYLPTEVVYSDQTGQKQLLTNRKENLVDQLRQVLKTWQFGRLKPAAVTSKNYFTVINQANTVALKYPSTVSVQIFGSAFNQKINRVDWQKGFNRVLILLDHHQRQTGKVYLLNDKTRKGYRVTVKKRQLTKVLKALHQAPTRVAITEQSLNGEPQVFYQNQVKVTQYSYLINKQNATDLMTTLMKRNSTDVTSKDSGHSTIYNDGNYRTLRVNHKQGTVSFEDYSQTNHEKQLTPMLTNSFKELSRLGTVPVNMRYFYFSPSTRTVVYRSYVEGYPVFNQTDFGTVEVQLLATGNKLDFSVYNLQVPLPSDKSASTLPSTQTVLSELLNAGYSEKNIKRIQVGYRWQVNQGSSSVIDLVPTYYVLMNKKWQSLDQWLAATGVN
jgi:hypothetical protein